MAIPVENLIFSAEERHKECIHSLPCKIHYSGAANISDFFTPAARDGNPDELSASFRGYPLNGVKVKLPDNYNGFVLEEQHENTTKKLNSVNTFNSITYWNWDRKPSRNDPFISALDWVDVSQIHDPVEDEDENEE